MARLPASRLTAFVPRNIVRPLGRYPDKFFGRLPNCSSLETFVKREILFGSDKMMSNVPDCKVTKKEVNNEKTVEKYVKAS
ncbi:hypothetical protein E2C01_014550 [Portunus trituberculatus]|uniref:Uncharacterized protein n=1 Tax=Portunus trituberculatus TaxID=210409 RepID=A0A5B7DKB7_PORTR|nr:hypothetical protein [Portunus trituberculatus]